MQRTTLLILTLLLLFMAGCVATQTNSTTADDPVVGQSVWAVDLIHTLPGQQAAYLRSIKANWAGARHLAQAQGAVLSYQALAAEPDSARGWDVMLMTEYVDSTAWARREEIFRAIFELPEFVRVETAQPSSELRTFFNGNVVLKTVVSK